MKCIIIGRAEWADRRVEVEDELRRAGCTIVQVVPREGESEVYLHYTTVPVEHAACGHTVEFIGGPSQARSDLPGIETVMVYPLKCPACGERP